MGIHPDGAGKTLVTQGAALDPHPDQSGSIRDAQELALDILRLSRNLLLIRLRFLEPAFLQLSLLPDPEGSLATDGFFIYYNFYHVLRRYQSSQELITFDYLHMVMHCLFHHPFIGPAIDPMVWDTAADIAVCAAILELDLPYVKTDREEGQREMLRALRKDVPILTAERLYHFFKEISCEPERLLTVRELFFCDDHELWYHHSRQPDQEEEPEKELSESEGDNEEDNSSHSPEADPDAPEDGQRQASANDGKAPQGSDTGEDANSLDASDTEGEESWREISNQVQTDLETLSSEFGQKAGSILRNLKEVTREQYDYGEFLRKFSVPGEVLKTSEEEFDYIYYTYGLELYKNVPLVEPLEYSEQNRIRDFVIVIDTSASVDGDLVQAFIRKTWNILKSTESFFDEINLHLIQCDAKVQQDTVLKSPRDLEDYLPVLQLKGFGGTDYRPAFQYIDALLEQKEFARLMGIIYFTDGEGIYPETQPDYQTAFVFIEDQFEDRDVPVWAMKLILEKEELEKY